MVGRIMLRVIFGILLMYVAISSHADTEVIVIVLTGFVGWIVMMRGLHMFKKKGSLL